MPFDRGAPSVEGPLTDRCPGDETPSTRRTVPNDELRYALRMKPLRRVALGVVVSMGAVVMVSCAPEPPDPEVLTEWVRDWDAEHDDERIVATATALVSTSTDDRQSETEVTATFAAPEPIASVEVSCFGVGTMRFLVLVQQGSSHVGVSTAEPLDCAASPHLLSTAELGISAGPVSAITLRGFDASLDTAWAVAAIP